ncbi:endoplasmic reticulum transmembrane helix translocase-like isoform 1-T5 [Megaptera novaeangliae]
MLRWRPRLSGSKTSDVRRCLCGNQRGAGKDGGGVGWVWGQRPVLRGSALLGLAHPVEQPKPRLQPRTLFAARVLLVAGPALTVSELVAALWPNRWLALLRRLTVLPFEGLLYLARLGAAATGCRGWQLDVGPRGHVARARHHVPRALTHRSLGALVRGRAVRTHLHPGRRWTGDLHAMEKKQSLHKAFPLGNVFSYYQSNREAQENSEVCEAE